MKILIVSQIADVMGISYKTAANNCTQIKAKLGTASTADLIRIAIQSGLTGPVSSPPSVVREPQD
jgi:DNA-binding CsgD family transcriptional regulator